MHNTESLGTWQQINLCFRNRTFSIQILGQNGVGNFDNFKDTKGQVRGSKRLGLHAGHQEVSRCCTRDKSVKPIAHRWRSTQARESTLALKSRTDITRNPKQGYHWLHKKDWCAPKIKKEDTKGQSCKFYRSICVIYSCVTNSCRFLANIPNYWLKSECFLGAK